MNAGKILCNDHLYLTFRNSSKLSAPNVKDAKSKKSSFVIVPLHRVRRENRFMYGPINKKEKQILEKSTDTSRNNSSLKDPELWWHLKLSKSTMKPLHTGKQFTVIKVKNLKTYDKIEKADRVSKDTVKKAIVNTEDNIKINSVTYKNIEAVEKTCDKQDRVSAINDNKRDDAIKTTDNTNKSEIPALKESQLFNMVINNMALFPIINPKKELPLMADKMDILSISGKDEPDTQHYPTVTKILSATLSPESKKLLEMWKARLIAEMGEDKFKEYYQEQLNSGVLFHSYIENTLYGKSAEVSESLQLAVDSLSNVLKELEAVKAIESHVSHKHLQYKGKMDCVAMYRPLNLYF